MSYIKFIRAAFWTVTVMELVIYAELHVWFIESRQSIAHTAITIFDVLVKTVTNQITFRGSAWQYTPLERGFIKL